MGKRVLAITFGMVCGVLVSSAAANAQTVSELIQSGNSAQNAGNYDLAIAEFTRAIQLDPSIAVAYMNRANAYKQKGQIDTALQDYNRAIQLDPNHAPAYSNRGNAYADKGEAALALADYDRAIQLDPNLSLAYSNRGLHYIAQGNYDQAMADLNRALALEPNLVEAWVNRGLAYYAKGDYRAAEADAMKALTLRPGLRQALELQKVARDKLAVSPAAPSSKTEPTPSIPYKCPKPEILACATKAKVGEPILVAATVKAEYHKYELGFTWTNSPAGRITQHGQHGEFATIDTNGVSAPQILTVVVKIFDREHPECSMEGFGMMELEILPADPKPSATLSVPLDEEENARIWWQAKEWSGRKSRGLTGEPEKLEIRFISGPTTKPGEGIAALNELKAYLVRQNIDVRAIRFVASGTGPKSAVEIWLVPRVTVPQSTIKRRQ